MNRLERLWTALTSTSVRRDFTMGAIMCFIFLFGGPYINLTFSFVIWLIVGFWIAMILASGAGFAARKAVMTFCAGIYAVGAIFRGLFDRNGILVEKISQGRAALGDKAGSGLDGTLSAMTPTEALVAIAVFVGLGLFFLVWVTRTVYRSTNPPAPAPAPATEPAPAQPTPPPTQPAPAAHANGHGGGSGWKWFFAVVAAIALLFLGAIVFGGKSGSNVPVVVANSASGTVPVLPPPVSVEDPSYKTATTPAFDVQKFDLESGEYEFFIPAPEQTVLPVVPENGQAWIFAWKDVKVCALAVPCVDEKGQGGRASSLVGEARVKYNADDFPVQNARYQEAVAFTGSGILELGQPQPWVVPASAVGKPVSVGFNIRRSEVRDAKGGGTLTLKITKK